MDTSEKIQIIETLEDCDAEKLHIMAPSGGCSKPKSRISSAFPWLTSRHLGRPCRQDRSPPRGTEVKGHDAARMGGPRPGGYGHGQRAGGMVKKGGRG